MNRRSVTARKTLSVALALCMVFSMVSVSAAAAPQYGETAVVAEWNYSAVPPAAAVPATGGENKDGALLTNFQNAVPGFSTGSLVITDWATGTGEKYWMLAFPSKDFESMTVSLAQRSSGTGPRDFKLQYSVDGNTWKSVTSNQYDASVVSTALAVTLNNVPLPAEANDMDMVYLRLLLASNISSRAGTGTYSPTELIASGGTSNINSIVVAGKYIGDSGPVIEKVAAVTANPAPGAIEQNAKVALACATQGALIKYTLNGTDYLDYEEAFAVASLPAVVKAYAVKEGMADSDIATFAYTLKEEQLPADAYHHYYGMLHSHTSNSDGTGSFADAFTMARDRAGLDYWTVTDHSNYFDTASNLGNFATGGGANGNRWANGLTVADEFTSSTFVGMMGFEMTWANTQYGHVNTFNTTGYVSRNNPRYTSLTNGTGLQNYYDDVVGIPQSITQFNHPGTTFGDFTDFAYYTPARDRAITLIEVGNGDGTNKRLNNGYWRSDTYYDRALSKGWHLAPTNNQDNHSANWGIGNDHRTVILATELTRSALYSAMANRRVYSTENKTMKVDFTVNGAVMGTIFDSEPATLDIHVAAQNTTDNLGRISLITKNGREVTSLTSNAQTAVWDFQIPAHDEYYYVKIAQPNGDLTLTAPVWVKDIQIEKQGVTSIRLDAGTPMWGTPINLTTRLFNDAVTGDFVVSSITYNDAEGNLLAKTEGPITVLPTGNRDDVVSITPTIVGGNTVIVTVIGTFGGVEKTYTEVLRFRAVDPNSVAKIVIDAAHMNNYVKDNYADNLQTLENYVADEGIVFVWAAALTDEVLADADGLIITTPYNRSSVAAGFQQYTYTEGELAVIKRFADRGGNLLLMARADYGEGAGDLRTFVIMNKVLDQFGVTTKVNGDELILNNTSTYQFSIPASSYTANGILSGLELSKEYRVYSAAGLVPGASTVRLINGIAGMQSYDSAHTGDAVNAGSGADMLVLAQEQTAAGGTAYVAGSVFCSSFESDENQYDNFPIAKAMLKSFKTLKVSTVAEARKGDMGRAYTIEGTVTSQSSSAGRDNAFFDCIYVQDDTGGICIHPVSDLPLYVGQKVRVSGVLKSYLGDVELGVFNENDDIEILDLSLNPLMPKEFTTADSMKKENEGWLAKIEGTVTKAESDALYLNDGTGEARVFMDGYIKDSKTGAAAIDANIAVGARVAATGLASTDTAGSRLRVRDLAEVMLAAPSEKTINILHTNDTHGRIYQVDGNNTGMIGIDRVAALKNSTANSILVDAGDTIHGLPIVNVNSGLNAIELMTAAGYSVMAPGNHDFNFGSVRLSELATIASAKGLDIISSNVFVTATGQSYLPTTKTVEIDGVKVGFFGLTTQTTPIVTNPVNVETIEFRAYKQSADNAISELKAGGAQIIVGLAHVSRTDIVALINELDVKPDVVIDGHDHILGSVTESGVLIAGDGQYQENLGMVSVTISSSGEIISKTAALIAKADTAAITGDPAVFAMAETMKQAVLALYDEVVAKSEVFLSSARGDNTTKGVRNSEQALGNLVADAMRAIGGADVALTNGGGLRADIRIGDITRGDLNSVLPFGNVLVIKEATPKALKEMMENGVQFAPTADGRFPQISGMYVAYDPAAEVGQKVAYITINGKPIDFFDDTTVLRLATNDFMANGGDGYTAIQALKTVAEIDSLDAVFEQYVNSLPNKTITESAAKIDGRILDYVPAVLALSIGVPAVSGIEGDVEFTLSLRGAEDVLSVELEFEIDGNMLAGKGAEALSGFAVIDGIAWRSLGGNIWKGALTIGYPSGDNGTGFASQLPVEVAKFVFAPRAIGEATMKLTGARVVGLVGDVTAYLDVVIEAGEATTFIDQLVYSKYDLNRDNKVDALDLGIMLLYCGFDIDSADWDTLVKVNDSKGKPVTASMCDVNGDGVIDMLDLLDLFIHYTK
ncbi:MAG: 5'-nucleotidase C-terminal domain-containing protein [Clostridiales bacterium]|nr:5'-nucleotidase C-terminal domain-containing protein [Clostridiales bacterium]